MTIKPIKSLFFAPFCAVIAAIIGTTLAFSAHAAITPTLSLSNLGNNQVQMNVMGDPNVPVNLYYYTQYQSSAQNVGVIGYTSNSQSLSATMSYGQYNIPSNAYVYVMVDGAISQSIQWPYYTNTNGTVYSGTSYPYTTSYSNVSFSQNSITIAPNQTTTVTLYGGSDTYYISQNSSLVSASISGNILTLSGSESGTGTLVVCSSNSSCGTLSITVTASSYTYPYTTYPYTTSYPTYQTYTPISLSQGTISLNAGQQEYLNIYGTGNYYIYSNSNPYAVTSGINSNTLWINGVNPGTSYVMVCESVGSSCTTLYVNVNAPVTYSYVPTYTAASYPIYTSYVQPVIQTIERPMSYLRPVGRFFSYFNPRNWGLSMR
jgi:hypothetical protein